MEEHVRVHDEDIVIQFGPRQPQRHNIAALILLIGEIPDFDATTIGPDGRANHLRFVPDHDHRLLDANACQRIQVPDQQRLSAQLEQAFRALLCDGPEPFSDARRQDDCFHQRTAALSTTRLKAARNPCRSCSERAPMLATRKILSSNCPCPA